MLRVTSKGKHIEWDAMVQHQAPTSPDSNMRKTRSVDFSRMTIRTSIGPHHNTSTTNSTAVASQFSRRAARGSFKSLTDDSLHCYQNMNDDTTTSDSDCRQQQHNQRLEYRSALRGSKDHLTDMAGTEDEEVSPQNNEEKSSFYRQLRQSFTTFVLPRFSLMKLSMCLLACATLGDMVYTNYLPSDRPTTGSRGVSLGSAAISSVTDTLSPILPFAGGLDLRRDDYWLVSEDSTFFKTLQSVYTQVIDAFAAKEEASQQTSNKKKKGATIVTPTTPRSNKKAKSSPSYDMAISTAQPFVSLETIAQLTLGDIGECFRYALESSNVDFSESRFYTQSSSSSGELRQVIQGMQDAVHRSRGNNALDWTRSPDDMTIVSNHSNDVSVDALKFAAAMRVFAEWRLLRQVPDGYKGFAIGMSLGHKDVVQNIIKMEESVHQYIDHQRDICQEEQEHHNNNDCDQLQTPTLRELLTHEVETGIHPSQRLPYLKEKSAGMGLLWVRRQLAYQTQIFDNVLHMKVGESMKNAVGAAYSQVYDPYHGWAVQKIFTYSFQAAPEAEEILRHMNPRRLSELMAEQRRRQQRPSSPHKSNGTGESEDTKESNDANIFVQVIDHVGGEWDKLAYNVVKIFNKDAEPPLSMIESKASTMNAVVNSVTSIDDVYVTNEMVKDAHYQIQLYLQRIQPILQSIQWIFEDLNMDDPTRV